MTTEQKAKAYNKVLEYAKKLHKENCDGCKVCLESLFPELAESEDDRVRKELITHCKNTRCVTEEGAEQIATWITWLEKQGKPKWSDGDESKVKEIVYFLDTAKVHYASTTALDDCIEWLKSLKQKMKKQ